MNHDNQIHDVSCALVRIGERFRKDKGDLRSLADSIAQEGLLQPIGIAEDGGLVFGERRLLAVRDILKRETIPARVVRVSSIVAGEYAENEIRKDFTPTERLAIAEAVRADIGNRQGQRTDKQLPQHVAEVAGQETRDIAAKKAGFGNRTTYQQARKVVEKAVEEVIAQMDSGQLSIRAAADIAEQPPERQKEIAAMLPAEQKQAVRTIRIKDLPTPAEAHRIAKEKNMAILDRTGHYQTPMPMSERKPLIERSRAIMSVFMAARDINACHVAPAEVARDLRSLDTPDTDIVGHCFKAAAFMNAVTQELNANAAE